MKKKCKVCNKNFLDKLNLGNHPCADTFLKNKNHAIKLKRYPLVVGYCKCSHLTSLHKVPEKERYEKYEYSYTSDNSPVSRLHFKKNYNLLELTIFPSIKTTENRCISQSPFF